MYKLVSQVHAYIIATIAIVPYIAPSLVLVTSLVSPAAVSLVIANSAKQGTHGLPTQIIILTKA